MAKRERIASREAEGGRQFSALFNGEEAKLLAKHEKTRGGLKAALVAGLRALDGATAPTPEEALKILEMAISKKKAKAK